MSCNNCSSKGFNNISTTEDQSKNYSLRSPYDWLKDLPASPDESNIVEVSFKNNRKDFYLNKNKLGLKYGDYVAVQCESGHGVGIVTLTGKMADLQLNRKTTKYKPDKIIYRLATKVDIDKLIKARLKEKTVMIKARQLVDSLKLDMKISDVEFQGDASKAIFFYIADGRVDFRELIKLYAQTFEIRIEMRQIGARQESGLIGGIGSCGRELCCSSWRIKFDSVTTSAAKVQELSHQAEKLTGQCGKLKCCLMYELDQYIEAHSDFPDELLQLECENGIAYPQKKDLLRKIIWYSLGTKDSSEIVEVSLERAKEIIQLNKKGIKPSLMQKSENQTEYTKFDDSNRHLPIDKNSFKKRRTNTKKKYKKAKK